jgi:hypothetical protein
MIKKIVLGFATVALAVASAATYRVNIYQPSVLNGKELKPGQYKLEVDGNKATLKSKDTEVTADVKVETTEAKISSSSIRFTNTDGTYKIKEIRLGGTTTKLVFD